MKGVINFKKTHCQLLIDCIVSMQSTNNKQRVSIQAVTPAKFSDISVTDTYAPNLKNLSNILVVWYVFSRSKNNSKFKFTYHFKLSL